MNVRYQDVPAAHPVQVVIGYEPRIWLTRAQLSSLNRVATRRLPFVTELAGKPLAIAAIGLEQTVPDSEPSCHFGLGSAQVRPILSLPESLVERLISSIQDGLGLPDEPLRSLMVELALAGLLDALDAEVTMPSRLEPAGPPGWDFNRVALAIQWGDWRGHACLHLPRSDDGASLAAVADLLGRMPQAPAAMDQLPLSLAFEIGASRLEIALLSNWRPGDVVLLQTYYPASGKVLVALGHTAADAALAGRAATLRGQFGPHPALAMEMSMNKADGGKASSADANATLDQIEVTLTFEFGRRTVDLRTLRAMVPGYVFDLGRDPAGPVDILANGKTIGGGEIVRIGDTIGVRATRLFLHD
ncbi:type III secretion system cytoplasmic ring protein SctQ [Bradyrhizobium sp. Arg237L]|uniref:type III secretion system cytoplasmic ring protein SctQ n=1 Tax=Bradyrhizobium sp. Arg237L TaxID=3003352 RepID=UPI00249EDF99|nr:type III secretion system cytoplasmic ring protein SctQ [Bradyrhizobium sp. Arg237L]MDI4231928.1 type III secretion system cytoplasmic ring protein SctQ [Bradyrhizobium sp. Arg237L]